MVAPGRVGHMLIWLLVVLAACSPARRRVRGEIVRRVHFEGNGGLGSGHNDYQLRKALEQEATAPGLLIFPLKYLVDPKLLSEQMLVRDAYRLEVWYAHRGWFDARFAGWSTRRVRRAGRRRAGVLDVHGVIEPGPPSLVRSYAITGATGAPSAIARTVLRTGYLKEKRQYALDLAELDRAELETRLQRRGYAYAKVELQTDVYPDQRAVDVELKMKPGIMAVNGPIAVEGNENIDARFILQNLRLTEGNPYRLDDIVKAQNRLFAMGTFSIVNVTPDLSDPSLRAVPIKVRVSESKFRSLRLGVGLAVGIKRFEPNLFAKFKHTNLFNQLIGVELMGRVGAVANVGAIPLAPTWETRASVIYPRIFGHKVAQQLEVKIEQGVQQGLYRFFNPQADFRTIWKPSDVLVLTMGPHVEQFKYLDLDLRRKSVSTGDFGTRSTGSLDPLGEFTDGAVATARRLFGDDFKNPYQITSVDFGMTLDWRDDPLSSRRGSFLSTTVRAAFPLRTGDFSFVALTGDWRLFRPIRIGGDVPLTLATRVHGKAIFAIGDNPSLPYPELFFPGGAASMRGFPSRAMGPYSIFVTDRDQRSERRFFIPQGGTLGVVLSEELRYYGAYDLTYAVFVDLATLANPGRPLGEDNPNLLEQLKAGSRIAGGVGIRYASPLGPFRIDVALRPRYSEDFQGYDAESIGACSTDDDRRRIDVIHSLFNKCAGGPALMVFGAFGEAI